jgi:hypothetical protein
VLQAGTLAEAGVLGVQERVVAASTSGGPSPDVSVHMPAMTSCLVTGQRIS